jgi:hypothetical protein
VIAPVMAKAIKPVGAGVYRWRRLIPVCGQVR